ncbi:MAG: hypothetical protein J0M05_06915 [Candidatus Kapabacteria bacterium]|jgi:hypothetical protein|nr:hypothetical protein [Ignavibacteria bacterium]MBN8573626.1 hypothetical protein [Candidatus Kapabacteria bacterium]HRI30446.1 hypothetical protein [Candidatus Kapabacteria bacterium]
MKHIFLIFAIIFLLGCGSDDAPTNTNTASRSIADYMLDGPVGTEYWYSQVGIRTDTNGRTGILGRDTIVWTILNRAYNHPILGNCMQVTVYRKFHDYLDTAYYSLSNNEIVYMDRSPGMDRILIGPIEKGTIQNVDDNNNAKIHALDVPMTTPAGNFSTVHVLAEEYRENNNEKYTANFYFTPKVLVCKIQRFIEQSTLTGKKQLEEYSIELFRIKKP